jgi:uncharacterized protein YjeT (DUF2065 family)
MRRFWEVCFCLVLLMAGLGLISSVQASRKSANEKILDEAISYYLATHPRPNITR